ncbi:DUF11 domain-containing protein [Streptosporangium sp. NBC_01495]|uniref:hypothetical protein n=1 Tax=Streptosporangium sp. NBC_01495 TaxID=2903899 RepID=UPI002E321A60|nr:hypothetical protein [Streptosporangium sp. NBC_01495]
MVGGSVFGEYAAARIVAGVICLVLAAAPRGALASPEDDAWGGADLSVRLTVSPKRAQPGQPLTYRAEVRNDGPGDAVLPLLTVRLPEEVEVIGVDVAECLPGTVAGAVVCPSAKDVLAGQTGGVTITGLVRSGARGPLEAIATLSSEVVDDDETDNSSRTLTEVDEGTDLAVRLSRATRAGRLVTVAAVVRNRGPRRVHDAGVLFDTGGARLMSARGARCDSHPAYVGCRLRTVGAGRRVSFLLAFVARAHAPRAEATVYSLRLGDRRPANNTARFSLR